MFQYRQPWLETRAALEAFVHDGDAPLTGGATAGVRVQAAVASGAVRRPRRLCRLGP